MVAVDGDGVAFDLGHGDHQRTALGLRLELHARLDALDTLEGVTRHFLDQLLLYFAVTFGGGNLGVDLVAGGLAFEFLFQTRNDVAGAVEVGQRLAAFRAVQHFTCIIGQGVVERDNGILRNLH